MSHSFEKSISEHIEVTNKILNLKKLIFKISKKISTLKNTENKLLVCGNGGSAADSQHLAAELVGRFEKDRNGFPAISLSNDSYSLTAIGNDFGFKNVFSRQIDALGKKGDILVAISTSGNSANVIEAVKTAKELDIFTIGLLGKNGGYLKDIVNLELTVENSRTARIQEMHILIIHLICELVEGFL